MLNIQNVIEKKGGEIRFAEDSSMGAIDRLVWKGNQVVREFSFDFDPDGFWRKYEEMPERPLNAIVSATEEVIRAEYVEVECPNIDYTYDEEHPVACNYCGGSGKLYRKQDCLVSTEVKE